LLNVELGALMTIYDKYNICKESSGALFISLNTGVIFMFEYGLITRVYSKSGNRYLGDLGGLNFFKNLEYVGDL